MTDDGVLLVGFAVMDGHDMGVGTLLPFVGRGDDERRVVINTVGPHWGGNQVWFITGDGAIFAAWPLVYATAYSGFYWAMLAVLWAFTIFWQFTTGEWRQYIPTLSRVGAMARYYVIGIFTGADHPYHKTATKKHNPLQRLTYMVLLAVVSPLIWGSGLLYLFRAFWPGLGIDRWLTLEGVAWAHTAGAFLMLSFVIVHVYLTTTGHTVFAHIKTMITGWEDVPDRPAPAERARH